MPKPTPIRSFLALLVILALSAVPAFGQWPAGLGSALSDRANAVVTSPTGDVYITGPFRGTLGSGSNTFTSNGLSDVFVAKFSVSGNLQWVFTGGGVSEDDGLALAVDDQDNVYVAGKFSSNALFGGTSLTGNSDGFPEAFVFKLDSDGLFRWARSLQGGGTDVATAVEVYPGQPGSGGTPPTPAQVFVAGEYSSTVATRPGGAYSRSAAAGERRLFVARLDGDGDWKWLINNGVGSAAEDHGIENLAIDPFGQLYASGQFTTPFSFATGSGNQTVNNSNPAPGSAWTKQINSGGQPWQIARSNPYAGFNSWYLPNVIGQTDRALATPSFTVATANAFVEWKHRYSFDWASRNGACYDGAVLEYQIGSGAWRDIKDASGISASAAGTFTSGNYNNTILNAESNPLGGRAGWCDRNPSWPNYSTVRVDLSNFVGEGSMRLRLRFGAGYAVGDQGWWVDNVRIEDGDSTLLFEDGLEQLPDTYISKLTNTLSSSPTWGWGINTPGSAAINDLATDAGSALLVAGTADAATVFAGSGASVIEITQPGAFVAKIRDTGSAASWQWAIGTDGGNGTAVIADNNFDVYLAGDFGDAAGDMISFTTDSGTTSLASVGGRDIFVAKVLDAELGQWAWANSGGGAENERAYDLSTDGFINLHVAGSFQGTVTFGDDESVTSLGDLDALIANIDADGFWFDIKAFTVGEPVIPPTGAEVTDAIAVPDIFIDGTKVQADTYFRWSPPSANADGNARLVPLQPAGGVEIQWRAVGRALEDPFRIPTLGNSVLPNVACTPGNGTACFQIHVATSPVEIAPDGLGLTFFDVTLPQLADASDAAVVNSTLNATDPGWAVITYYDGAPDLTTSPLVYEVVRTVDFQDALVYHPQQPCEIGTEITDGYHDEPTRAGYVLFEKAFYDGSALTYSRAAREGQILPVNRVSAARPLDGDKRMAVSWYRGNSLGVYWPSKASEYDCRWPVDPDKIIVASELGSEVLGQPLLTPFDFPSRQLYNQPDPNLPGYNPNDEHALFAPSNAGSGIEALFALRADFGSGIAGDSAAASDPYALLKYFDVTNQKWRIKVYQVFGTGAGYDSFQYSGLAGTPVNPPYPLTIFDPCDESTVEGEGPNDLQPPAPFFRDHTARLWAKSSGNGAINFWYIMQPTFFYDIDNNNASDVAELDCVPWMPRLATADGGTANTTVPIRTTYSIAWPSDVAILTVGETLLTPKRGLPDIFNQAAVEIVFDELQDANPDDPTKVLAQIIDPLNPRTAFLEPSGAPGACTLEDLPSDIATELNTSGKEVLKGSADGTVRLPFAIQSRILYDPLNHKLTWSGVFDEAGAGEPLLLLNVMSKNDRDALKSISSDPEYDTCVDQLFATSRNPNGISKICSSQRRDATTGNLVCDADDPVTTDDILVGWKDDNNDGILEPFQGVGIKPALTAGAAQATGFLTLAFNNDPSLTDPVGLEIIRVDCLVSPEPPASPDLISTYQGELKIIFPENVFDELITLRHSGDFGGAPDNLEFEWFFKPDENGLPPFPLPDPEGGQLNGWFKEPVPALGSNEINIGGANIKALSDNWFIARYRGLGACQNQSQWSIFAGQPGATPLSPRAQLAEGWVKRVIKGLNPFESRVKDFHRNATNTYASMLVQLGERFEGPIALNSDPDNLNNVGLIEAYETVKRRGLTLSVDATPPVNYGPANNAILLVTSRLSDFYMLLGNEAYADAQDPTVGISTTNGDFASLAPTIFNFQNQAADLLEEELVLLRGRDDIQGPVAAPPIYNRYFWNFTTGQGEVAYALSYNIADQNVDGVIDEDDAQILYPQGHGDAWGHYLTAIKMYYDLLQHPFFSWVPRPEAVTVANVPIQVDFLDERKFAQAAAARAKTGAEIADLTYRAEYVEDPEGQWQGYKDTDPERAWGLDGWGRRAGQGAYFDWVVGNSLLPAEDPDPSHFGIQKIDRKTVDDLDEIIASARTVQAQIDEADRGLNPLGLAKGVVPFDLDPSFLEIGSGVQGLTHFEQVFERAEVAVDNAVRVWDYANDLTRMLRFNQDSIDELTENAVDVEFDYEGRLIEIFGTPIDDDIGPGGTYPAGYEGPDYFHYTYVDFPSIFGTRLDEADLGFNNADIQQVSSTYKPSGNGINFYGTLADVEDKCGGRFADYNTATASGCPLGDAPNTTLEVTTNVWATPDLELGYVTPIPSSWTGRRRVTGQLQSDLTGLAIALLDFKKAIKEYDNLKVDIQCAVGTLQTTYDVAAEKIEIMQNERRKTNRYLASIAAMNATSIALRRIGAFVGTTFKNTAHCIVDKQIVGFSNSIPLTPARCALELGGSATQFGLDTAADAVDVIQLSLEAAKEDLAFQSAIQLDILDNRLEFFNQAGGIETLVRQEPVLRADLFQQAQAIQQAENAYLNTLAEGLRLQEERATFRKNTAAAVQESRLQDFAFRVFRNDALQKYRASFDLAARYSYLAATAYDYETNLLGTDSQSGREFLTDIVRQRSLGQILDGELVPGSRGLADPLGRMQQNFTVLKTQMGFNNPQIETNRFSLRREMFRIETDDTSDDAWRAALQEARVENLFDVPEFRRYARPFAPESLGPQPGLVIPFSTTVTFGLNYFGWPLGPGDSAYDPSQYSTRIRSAGVWFELPDGGLPISNTPRVYLIPVGADVLRPPTPGDFATREWTVVDQVLPVPFPIGATDLDNDAWIPAADTLSDGFGQIRRHPSLRAYHFEEPFDDSEVISDSRLVGRSVWNTQWLLVIPGGTLLNDPVEGLQVFIEGPDDGTGERTGIGIQDIRIFFETYAYSGL